ncbi:MFS transporter [Clostridia bacterium]|nr:MFS transporter [Clostridia bacterium]
MIKNVFRRFPGSPFTRLYDEAGLPQQIQRSLFFVMIGNMCGNIHGTITTGSALAGYAGALGANDFVFGVLTAIPFIGTLLQIPAAGMVSKAGKRKKFMISYGVFSRSMWLFIGLVPYFVPMSPLWLRIWAVILLSCVSSVTGSFINVCFTSWLSDLVPIGIRGRWISCRDRIIALIGIAVGLLTAYLLDSLPGYVGYSVVFIAAGLFGIMDMVCFVPAVEIPMKPAANTGFAAVARGIVANKPFFRFMIFWTMWSFTTNLHGPFITRYALDSLHLSFLQVTVFGQLTVAAITVLAISRWGRIIDSYGCKPTLWISCIVTAITPAFMLFSVPGSPVTFFLHNMGSTFWIACNLAAGNMLMALSPSELRPSYIAFYACFTSIAGSFSGVLLGGALLQWIPHFFAANGITFFGAAPDQYKLVFAIGVICRLSTVFIFVPSLTNDRDSTISDLKNELLHKRR